jgi:hypothetical protein
MRIVFTSINQGRQLFGPRGPVNVPFCIVVSAASGFSGPYRRSAASRSVCGGSEVGLVAFLLQPNMDPTGRLFTGQRALRITRSDVVPRRASRNPSGPSLVMMIRSVRSSVAVCKMMSCGVEV